jgi:hypothetical protein
LRLILLGFSRGAVVLNQLVCEIAGVDFQNAAAADDGSTSSTLLAAAAAASSSTVVPSDSNDDDDDLSVALQSMGIPSNSAVIDDTDNNHLDDTALRIQSGGGGDLFHCAVVSSSYEQAEDEKKTLPLAPTPVDLLGVTTELHWLDGGNGNTRGSFPPTAQLHPSVLRRLCANSLLLGDDDDDSHHGCVTLCIHGTSYQWSSECRPWIVEEKDSFVDVAQQAGVQAVERFYDGDGSLEAHFGLLERFCTATELLLLHASSGGTVFAP